MTDTMVASEIERASCCDHWSYLRLKGKLVYRNGMFYLGGSGLDICPSCGSCPYCRLSGNIWVYPQDAHKKH